MAKTDSEKLEYNRGYQRGIKRQRERVQRALEIARGYKAAGEVGAGEMLRCRSCRRWTRGGENCLWGHCRADFEPSAGEGAMWADEYRQHGRIPIATHETFGCINWIPWQHKTPNSETVAALTEAENGTR